MRGRLNDLVGFYKLLSDLSRKIGGPRCLAFCNGRDSWPKRGVYFFFEDGQFRSDSGSGPRVVRVGTHALTIGSKSTLWGRLSNHAGSRGSGGGNHRGSIFRLLTGTALKQRDAQEEPLSWGRGADAKKAASLLGMEKCDLLADEAALEVAVSQYVRRLPFLWLEIDDEPSPQSDRRLVEQSSIALISNYQRAPLDASTLDWLGHHCDRERVRNSGLWNSNHVDEDYDPDFLDRFRDHVVAQS